MSDLVEKEAIRDVLHRYCYGTDAGDTELWVEGFTDDCVWDGGPFGVQHGTAAMRAFHGPNADASKALRHLTLNTVIDLHGDTAHAVSYVVVLARSESFQVYFAGFYDDDFVKLAGRWRIRRRLLRADLSEIERPRVRA